MYTRNIFLFNNIFVHAFIALNINFFSVSSNFRGLRIFQGRDAKSGEFPYVVALSMKWSYPENTTYESFESFCTGSIVTPIWVLTAGHCIRGVQDCVDSANDTSKYNKICKPVIQFVSPADNYNWNASNIITTIRHPSFSVERITNKLKVSNDIALVKVQNTAIRAFGKISPVHFGTMYGHKVFSLGLGMMQSESGQLAHALALNKPLQVYDAIVVKCGQIKNLIRSSLFCLSWNCQKPSTSCAGDSGGPIVHPSGIIGLTTAGNNEYCNSTENTVIAVIATPVSPYVDWIARSIRGI